MRERRRKRKALPMSFVAKPEVRRVGECFQVLQKVAGQEEELRGARFFIHYGPYGQSLDSWIDQEVSWDEIDYDVSGHALVSSIIRPGLTGEYGATYFAIPADGSAPIWAGGPYLDDAKFTVSEKDISSDSNVVRSNTPRIDSERLRLKSVDLDKFVRHVHALLKTVSVDAISRTLFTLSASSSEFRSRLSVLHHEIGEKILSARSKSRKLRLETVQKILENIGIGEVVFVAPEGPHASGGGLSQVMVGLTASLVRRGIPATLITPLYENAQGNKHPSAESVVANGIHLLDENVPLKHLGRIWIDFGPTYFSGTNMVKRFRQRIPTEVYEARVDSLRVLFLRHGELASELYPDLSSDEHLRRAIFLSRGALEVMRDERFGVSPHIIITNDWLTGLVPVYLKLDPRFSEHPKFGDVDKVHILHNAGKTYQGRLYVNQFGEDLWPVLQLPQEHFFGLSDPEDKNYLNLTAGAIFHVGEAIVAVSRPYAQELFTESGGEGLHKLFSQKADAIFGISNGINVAALRNLIWDLGERARSKLGLQPLAPQRYTDSRVLKRLGSYKEAIKQVVQQELGLKKDPQAVLVSLVGRLAEQKGISLLTEPFDGSSVLERILVEFPETQIIIGGPPSRADSAARKLITTVEQLSKRFPNRIAGLFDFIPHSSALEITGASDLFLMPSRYEPGGISQLEALATGAAVIARNVGGISATLKNCNDRAEQGNSFLFDEYTPSALYQALTRALGVFRNQQKRKDVVWRAATAEHDWMERTTEYLALLQYISGVFSHDTTPPYLGHRQEVLERIRPITSSEARLPH
ncbi:MAG: glycogen/starch synthase [Bdellovibrionales bacterium]|nr:glycogen/starch synthase [Bdellovibrionales bacterium]